MTVHYQRYYYQSGFIELPDTFGVDVSLVVPGATWGKGMVKITPALVPIHSKSLHAKSDVTRKHAALCCLMMSSQPIQNINHC